MKKIILKVVNWIAYYGACVATGTVLGRISNWLLTLLGVTEESAEAHPWRAFILSILLFILVIILPGFILVWLVYLPIHNHFDEKIDEMDEDPFEKE